MRSVHAYPSLGEPWGLAGKHPAPQVFIARAVCLPGYPRSPPARVISDKR